MIEGHSTHNTDLLERRSSAKIALTYSFVLLTKQFLVTTCTLSTVILHTIQTYLSVEAQL